MTIFHSFAIISFFDHLSLFFFFFQAEDGIRDLYVTGVQTCALPISAGVLGAAFTGAAVVGILLLCGLIELGYRSQRHAQLSAWPALVWMAFKVGALSFGGGYVIIPLMYGDAVHRHGWMADQTFANAVAYGQITPGPVTHTVALVGYAAEGFPGAL